MPNVKELFLAGQKSLIDKANAREKEKAGTLRVGNTGMLTQNGEVFGKCMAQTWLRYKGIDVKGLEDDGDNGGAAGRELMFEGGRTNEDSWAAVLAESWGSVEGQGILREEEIPVRWMTSSGIPVTGRPDMVLTRGGKPVLGIELKQVSSFWTAYEVKVKGVPKYDHLLQAAHYAWQLGVPYELWYTARTDYHINEAFIKNQLPEFGTVDYMAYGFAKANPKVKTGQSKVTKAEWDELDPRDRRTSPLKILPFIQGYSLKIEKGVLWYKKVEDSAWNKTDIKTQDIISYYEAVPELTEVPPEAGVKKGDGSKAGYKSSDYCSLKELCCRYREGQNIQDWAKEVQKAADNK